MIGAAGAIGALCALLAPQGADYPIQPVAFSAVRFEGGFWGPRLETNRAVTIPYDFAKCAETGRLDNFAVAGGLKPGAHRGQRYDDSDVYKVIEGACYALAVAPDPALETRLDELIAWIAAAQQPDGYLYTARTIDPAHMPDGTGPARFSFLQESHELYCLGHLFEAAAAHQQATGKSSLMGVAVKAADLLVKTFGAGPDQRHAWEGHQEVEIGLAKLYRVTGERAYLNLARYFLDARGTETARPAGMSEDWLRYLQAHQPPATQTEAVGHAVRAGYMYSAMADVAALTGDDSFRRAAERLWQDVVERKTYLTGGIGARANGEAFGDAYELPNASAYAETCAAVANALWNQRMFLLSGEPKYLDVLERVLYNGFLSGVSLSGDRFFYPNPLARADGPVDPAGDGGRAAWFGTSCCPVNVARMVPAVPGMQFAVRGRDIFVNLYQAGVATLMIEGRELVLTMRTNWPWEGKVDFTAELTTSGEPLPLAFHLRMPNGTRRAPMPGGLYAYLSVGEEEPDSVFQTIRRTLQKGGSVSVQLDFELPVRRVLAREDVAADRGRVAIERGPLVYCVEAADCGGRVEDLWLPDDAELKPKWEPGLLGGVTVLEGQAKRRTRDAGGAVVSVDAPIRMIPYYAWANRGSGGMAVWLPRSAELARLPPEPTLANAGRPSASHCFEMDTAAALNDRALPESSADSRIPRHTFWPHLGGEEWLRYEFSSPTRIRSVRVYWFDDTGAGRCRVPASAQVEWLDSAGAWQPVNAVAPLGVARDAWNEQSFAPVSTQALRLRVRLQEGVSAGALEWEVR